MDSTRVATSERLDRTSRPATRPYLPSAIVGLQEWVDRLPGPAWVFYLGIGFVLVFLYTGLKWLDGVYPVGTFFAFHVIQAGMVACSLALLHYLKRAAGQALAVYRPALVADEAEYTDLLYRFTTLPSRPTWWILGAALVSMILVRLVYGLFSPSSSAVEQSLKLGSSPALQVIDLIVLSLSVATSSLLLYCTVRLLAMINTLYTTRTRVNLLQLEPLYAFSGLTARAALGMALLPYLGMAAAPQPIQIYGAVGAVGIAGGIYLPIMRIVAATFLWPLVGIHGLLVAEKSRLLGEVMQRLERAYAELNRRADAGELAEMDALDRLINNLLGERDVLAKVPTWPWRPETVRSLGTAVVLPIVLWFVLRLLERFVGP